MAIELGGSGVGGGSEARGGFEGDDKLDCSGGGEEKDGVADGEEEGAPVGIGGERGVIVVVVDESVVVDERGEENSAGLDLKVGLKSGPSEEKLN